MACVGGDQQIVESIIHAWKMKKKLPEEALARALLSACEEGKKDVVMILMTTVDKVKRGKILLDKKKGGNTCLMHACKNGHLSVILFILEVVSEIMVCIDSNILQAHCVCQCVCMHVRMNINMNGAYVNLQIYRLRNTCILVYWVYCTDSTLVKHSCH